MQRLDKILSDAGVASRKELRGLIRTGRVQVNGVPALRPEEKFDEKTAELTIDGAPVEKLHTVLLMLHKPAGYVTSTDDPGGPSVLELIPERFRRFGVMPVGRLDKATEGAAIIYKRWRIGSPAHQPALRRLEALLRRAYRRGGRRGCPRLCRGNDPRRRHAVPPGAADTARAGEKSGRNSGGKVPPGAQNAGCKGNAGQLSPP